MVNDREFTMVDNMLRTTSYSRRLRPSPHIYLEKQRGRMVVTALQPSRARKPKFQVLAQDDCSAFMYEMLAYRSAGWECQCRACYRPPVQIPNLRQLC